MTGRRARGGTGTTPSGRPATRAPAIEDLRLGPLSDGDPTGLARGADLEAVEFADLTLTRLDLSGALVATSRFTRLTVEETELVDARLSEVELGQVALTVVRADGTRWREVSVSGRLGAVEAPGAQWWSVHFLGCKLGFVNLRDAELLDVAFTDCIIDELDISGATVRRTALPGTRVTSLRARESSLQDVDLRGATLASVDGITSLRGATVSPDQVTLLAPLLAEGLGLRVEE